MARNVTLGGERLGSGKKMKVELKAYERSTHDLGYIWRSTAASGTLIPFMTEVALPGDTFDIDLDCDVKTHPTIGPLFGSFKVQLDTFLIPIRLYQAQLHNNKTKIGLDMQKIHLPQLHVITQSPNFKYNMDNQQINPSSILSYLNIRGVGKVGGGPSIMKVEEEEEEELNELRANQWPTGPVIARDFNAVPFIGYWDIYKNYYANKQEELGAVIHAQGVFDTNMISIQIIFSDETEDIILQKYDSMPVNFYIDFRNVDTLRVRYAGDFDVSEIGIHETSLGRTIPLTEIYREWVKNEEDDTMDGRGYIYNRQTLRTQGWQIIPDLKNRKPRVEFFPLENLDTMREDILEKIKVHTPFMITKDTYAPYGLVLGNEVGPAEESAYYAQANQEGLGLKGYQSDLFNNWLATEWIDGDNGINAITAIDTSSGSFQLDTLNLSKKIYMLLNRVAVSGGTYYDWIDAAWSHESYRQVETPVYMGGLIKELVFQEVISNAESSTFDGEQPLGTLAGRGVMSNKHKGGRVRITADEPSYIMGIFSLTPRVDYSQGNKWDTNLKTMNDFHMPELDQIGFQDLLIDQMAWWDTTVSQDDGTLTMRSAGKQPAWVNYMTNVNVTRGNFAIEDEQMFMTLNRRYEANGEGDMKDLTTYIDPAKFNHIFAQTSRDAQNFWVQIGVDITARRKMSAKVMPNL